MDWPFKTSDEQWMWRVRNHDDHAAFGKLLTRWEAPIHRLCTRMLGDAHRAQDLTQEAFTRVFANRHRFDAKGKFSTWLWRITLNLCHDELRRRSRHPESEWSDSQAESHPELEAANLNPSDSLAAAERQDAVRLALQQLTEPYRTVIILRHYENLKFGEIANILNVPEGTVKSRMAEGLSRLARRLNTFCESSPSTPNHAQTHTNLNSNSRSTLRDPEKKTPSTNSTGPSLPATPNLHTPPLLPS